jgi:hypothetical protein
LRAPELAAECFLIEDQRFPQKRFTQLQNDRFAQLELGVFSGDADRSVSRRQYWWLRRSATPLSVREEGFAAGAYGAECADRTPGSQPHEWTGGKWLSASEPGSSAL